MPPARWSPGSSSSSPTTATCTISSTPSRRRSTPSTKPPSARDPTASRNTTRRTGKGARFRPPPGQLPELKPAPQRVAGVDENRVEGVEPRPAGDARHDRSPAADLRRGLDPPVEQGADDALVDEFAADREAALGGKLRHPRRGAGAARRAVERALAIEHRIAPVRAGIARAPRPLHMADAADRRVLRMLDRDGLVDPPPQDGAPAQEPVDRYLFKPWKIRLRIDDRVEIAAIGDVDDKLAEPVDPHPDP